MKKNTADFSTEKLFELVKASQLLPLAGIEYNTVAKNKMRGKDNYGKPTDFTPEEKTQMETAFWEWVNGTGMKLGRGLVLLRHAKPKKTAKRK